MAEKHKYEGIYSSPDKYPSYGHSNHGGGAVNFLTKWSPKSILDVGCGFNEFVKSVLEKSLCERAVGVDFACPGADIIAEADALPFKNKEFDVVTSFDMMEHLPEESVDSVLREMCRVSNRFVLSISYVDSVNRWKGETLHPTVRPEHWWMVRLVRAGALSLKKVGRYITGTWGKPLSIDAGAKVVVVGNGPSILDAKNGKLIDAFDEVIRFNDYTIEGFQDHTGQRTTLWSTFFRNPDRTVKHPRVFLPHESTSSPEGVAEEYRMASWYFDRVRKHVQARKEFRYGFVEYDTDLLASSGTLLVCYLLEVVGVKKIHLAGFDHFSKHRLSGHHYWLNKAFKKPKEHDGDIEKQLFTEFLDAGRVGYL